MVAQKYIIVPEFAPLWAMKRCFGPSQGPLKKPTKAPIDVIGDLLKQTGKEKVTIYEVVPTAKAGVFSEPIQLTVDNYKVPYEELAGIQPTIGGVQKVPEEKKPEPVEPTIVPSAKSEPEEESAPEADVETDAENEEKAPEAPVEPPVEAVPEAPVVETTTESNAVEQLSVEGEETSDPAENVTTTASVAEDPYAGMTKAERKAARRAAAREAAKAEE